jgi:RimJ/RimL family protein N-acetyltransferase
VAFVPDDFQPPLGLVANQFVLEPLGPEHNEADHEAWSSSIEHIRATPGFPDGRWPRVMTLEENRADLERHVRDFAARSGFTYTVLDPSDRGVIGCVYIYPDNDGLDDAVVTSWVRATRAACDPSLRELVSRWLVEAWPFEQISYARSAWALGTIGLPRSTS